MSSSLQSLCDEVRSATHAFGMLLFLTKDGNQRILAIDTSKCIGVGLFSKVYLGYFSDDEETHYAIKIKEKAHPMEEKELAYNQLFYKVYQPIELEDKSISVMEYLPGKQLAQYLQDHSSPLHKLSVGDRLALIVSIFMQWQLFSEPISNTTKPFIHGDISDKNILCNISDGEDIGQGSKQSKELDAHVIDFDCSVEITNINGQRGLRRGTPLFMAPEIFNDSSIGVKSDVYSLAGIVSSILGCQKLFKHKEQHPMPSTSFFKAPYDMHGLLAFDKSLPIDIKQMIHMFLNQMQYVEMAKRPTPDMCLRFFMAAWHIAILEEQGHTSEPKYYECKTQMILLANGYWQSMIGAMKHKTYGDLCYSMNTYFYKRVANNSQQGHCKLIQLQWYYIEQLLWQACQFCLNGVLQSLHWLCACEENERSPVISSSESATCSSF